MNKITVALLVLLVTACAQKKLSAPSSSKQDEVQTAIVARATPTPVYEFPQTRPLDEAKPVRISSDSLEYLDKGQETRFKGHVKVRQDGATLYADRLVAKNEGETAEASGNILLVDETRKVRMKAQSLRYANQLSVADMDGGIEIVSVDPYGRPLTVTGKSGTVWLTDGRALVRGGVDLQRGAITASAKTARVDREAGLLVMDETVKLNYGKNRFRAGRATMHEQGGKLVLEDNVRAIFIPAEIEEAAENPGEAR